MKERNYVVRIIGNLIGSILVGIVAYGFFYTNKILLGIVDTIWAITFLISFVIALVEYKKSK